MKFESIAHGPSGPEYRGVLRGITFGELCEKDLSHMASQNIPFVAETDSFHQRLINCQITAGLVLDEKGGIRQMLEQLGQGQEFGGEPRRGLGDANRRRR